MKNAEWKCLLYCIATSYAHQWKDLWARWSLASALTLSASHFQAPWKLATYNSAVLRSYPECNNAILMQHLYIAFYINISNNGLQYSCINMCTFGWCSSVHVFLQLDNCTFKKCMYTRIGSLQPVESAQQIRPHTWTIVRDPISVSQYPHSLPYKHLEFHLRESDGLFFIRTASALNH